MTRATPATHDAAKSLLAVPSPTARARVFCIPYSGCGASKYRRWRRECNGVDYCPLQLPGREHRMREPSYRTFTELAQEFARGLAPDLDRPKALFGHCTSALAADETAVEFQCRGLPAPTGLPASSQVAPQDGPAGQFLPMDDAELIKELEALMQELSATLSCLITAIGWLQDEYVPADLMGGWPRCGDSTRVLFGKPDRFAEGPADLLDVLQAGVLGG